MEDSCFLQETCIWAFGTSLLPQPSLKSPAPICFHDCVPTETLIYRRAGKQCLGLSAWVSVYLTITKGLEGS